MVLANSVIEALPTLLLPFMRLSGINPLFFRGIIIMKKKNFILSREINFVNLSF